MTPEPYAGWLSMEPDRANLELRPDAPPPEPRRWRMGCSVFVVAVLVACVVGWLR